jgi:hypothetical protein
MMAQGYGRCFSSFGDSNRQEDQDLVIRRHRRGWVVLRTRLTSAIDGISGTI